MPLFCDVALPVPLDQTFTYGVNGVVPVVGARVLVPFSGQRLMGVVVKVHENAPEGVEVKPVQQVLDDAALLPDELMKLAGWIAQYYADCRGGQEGAVRGRGEGVFATVEAVGGGTESRVFGAELSGGWDFGEGVGAAVGYGGEQGFAGGDGQKEVAGAGGCG
jgi:hypothetical protein